MGDRRAGTTAGSHAKILLMVLWRMGGVLSKTWISKEDQERIFKVRREHGPTCDSRSSSGTWQLAWVRSAQRWLQFVSEPEQSLHPSRASSTQKRSSHFVLQLPGLCWARDSKLQDRDTRCLDCTCRITGSDLGVGWQHFIEAILYFLCCSIAMAPCREDPCGGAEFLWGRLPSRFRGFPAACGSSGGCPEPRILQPQPVRQHIAPCVITMVFTTLTPFRHVFIITTVILELQSRSILCKSGMLGSAKELVTPFHSRKTWALGGMLTICHRKRKCSGTCKESQNHRITE